MNYLILYRDIYTFQMAKWHNSKNQEHLYKTSQNIRNMRQFAEFWQTYLNRSPLASRMDIK